MSESGRNLDRDPTIFLVDDELAIVETLGPVLERSGFKVETETSGSDALARLEAVEPDLLLVDERMPGVGGLEVLDSVRTRWPDLPVVVMTSVGSRASAERVRDAGHAAYLEKPFSNKELVDGVWKLLVGP